MSAPEYKKVTLAAEVAARFRSFCDGRQGTVSEVLSKALDEAERLNRRALATSAEIELAPSDIEGDIEGRTRRLLSVDGRPFPFYTKASVESIESIHPDLPPTTPEGLPLHGYNMTLSVIVCGPITFRDSVHNGQSVEITRDLMASDYPTQRMRRVRFLEKVINTLGSCKISGEAYESALSFAFEGGTREPNADEYAIRNATLESAVELLRSLYQEEFKEPLLFESEEAEANRYTYPRGIE